MSTTLAQRLRLLRGEMPQAEFAALVGIHKSSWGRYERGVGEPTASDLARVCAACAVTPLWLLCGQGDMRTAGAEAGTQAAMPSAPEATPQAAKADCPAPEPLPPAETAAPPACGQCRWLAERLDQSERERRELARENRQLWRENGELRERFARLEERARRDAGE